MASTVYVDLVGPPVNAAWLNDVNNFVYNSAGVVVYENNNTLSTSYTIGTNNNAMSAGPITINSGVSITIPSGSFYYIF